MQNTATKGTLMQPGAWTFAPLAILEARNLSSGAKNAYFAICGFIWPRAADRIMAAEKVIAESYGKTDRTFRRHAAELAKVHAIGIVRRAGVPSTYVLLDLDKADLDRADRQEPTPVESDCELRTELTGVARHKEKVAKKTYESTTSNGSRAASKRRELAVAFVQQTFQDENSQRRILRRHAPEEILWAKRELELKPGKVKNPPGLVVYFLKLPKSRENLSAAANEMEHGAMKKTLLSEDQVERARQRRASTEKDIYAWLNEQPDRAELVERAQKNVKLILQGGRSNFQTTRRVLQGFLWRIRRQRERN